MEQAPLFWALSRVLACCLFLAAGILPAQEVAERELTLEAARAEALAANADLRAASARVEEARGRLIEARTYPHNPDLELELGDRDGTEGSSSDRGVGLTQELELAGQRGKRTAAAREELAAVEADLARLRREVLAATEIAFVQALAARDLLAVAESDVELTAGLASFEERRLEAGAGTQLDLNLARAASGRAQNRRYAAEVAWLEERARLAKLVGADPVAPPLPIGDLPLDAVLLRPLEELAAQALGRRADLEALRREVARAERIVELERALAVPNLRFGAFSRREEGDDVVGGSLSMAIPLFDRNQGRRAEARAALSSRSAELLGGERGALREVAGAYARASAASRALAALEGLVVGTLEENLRLLQQAFEAGKVNASDVLVLRRELVEGRREQIAVAEERAIAVAELEVAIGGVAPAPALDSLSEPIPPQENEP